MRTLADIITALRRIEPDLRRRYPIRGLGVFGSYVRGEQTDASDLDILVDLGPGIGLIELVGLQQELGDTLDSKSTSLSRTHSSVASAREFSRKR